MTPAMSGLHYIGILASTWGWPFKKGRGKKNMRPQPWRSKAPSVHRSSGGSRDRSRVFPAQPPPASIWPTSEMSDRTTPSCNAHAGAHEISLSAQDTCCFSGGGRIVKVKRCKGAALAPRPRPAPLS